MKPRCKACGLKAAGMLDSPPHSQILMLLIAGYLNAKLRWKLCGLKTTGISAAVLLCSFISANATYSRVAQCEAEIEGLQTENSRYN